MPTLAMRRWRIGQRTGALHRDLPPGLFAQPEEAGVVDHALVPEPVAQDFEIRIVGVSQCGAEIQAGAARELHGRVAVDQPSFSAANAVTSLMVEQGVKPLSSAVF